MTDRFKYYFNKIKISRKYSANGWGFIKYLFLTPFFRVFNFQYKGARFFIRREDFVSLDEILDGDEYAIINRLPQDKNHIAFDLGANIGLFSLYFLNRFPLAKVISVEASTNTYEILQKTIQHQRNPNWTGMNKAVYNELTTIYFTNSGSSTARKILDNNSHSSAEKCETITINDLINLAGSNDTINSCITIKMDIEGAEEKVVLQNNGWLEKVDFLIIELHENVDKHRITDTLNTFFNYTLDLSRGNSQKPLLLFSKQEIKK
ncbi:MAG: FkbM family methyltransferase [Ferruginibacter sp.]